MPDDSLADGEVLVSSAFSTGDGQRVYHTSLDCLSVQQFGDDGRRTTVDSLGDHWRICEWCAGTDDNGQDHGVETTCPFCGESHYALAKHLPECSEKPEFPINE